MLKKKKLIIIFSILFLISAYAAKAQLLQDSVHDDLDPGSISSKVNLFGLSAGFDTGSTVAGVLYLIIQGFLSLLGTIFVILIIYGGYLWMTAAGNEDQLKKAKDTIKKAVVGFLIIVSAYSITRFVFTRLPGNPQGPSGSAYYYLV